MHEFKHMPTSREVEAFVKALTGEEGLSASEMAQILNLNAVAWRMWCDARNFTISEVLVGKEVSLDVSSDDVDFDRRIFGKVSSVSDTGDSFIILVEEESRNFDHTQAEYDQKIGEVVWRYFDRMSDPCELSDPAETILGQFVSDIEPLIDQSIELKKSLAKPPKDR